MRKYSQSKLPDTLKQRYNKNALVIYTDQASMKETLPTSPNFGTVLLQN